MGSKDYSYSCWGLFTCDITLLRVEEGEEDPFPIKKHLLVISGR